MVLMLMKLPHRVVFLNVTKHTSLVKAIPMEMVNWQQRSKPLNKTILYNTLQSTNVMQPTSSDVKIMKRMIHLLNHSIGHLKAVSSKETQHISMGYPLQLQVKDPSRYKK